jgi:uncharacterized protein
VFSTTGLRDRITASLRAALSERDMVAASALRTLLGALDNATAVDVTTLPAGATEVPRREIDLEEALRIAREEQRSRHDAVRTYERLGQLEVAQRLRREIDVIERVLTGA